MSVNAAAGTSTATVEHQATVDKGLKMKIKRKNVNKTNTEASVKVDSNSTSANGCGEGGNSHQNENTPEDTSNPPNAGSSSLERLKQVSAEKEKDKVRVGRGAGKKERGNKEQRGGRVNSVSEQVDAASSLNFTATPSSTQTALSTSSMTSTSVSAGGASNRSQLSPDPPNGSAAKRSALPDPYEFNARVEDRISLPLVKKIKMEKMEQQEEQAPALSTCDVGVDTSTIGVITDPDCLGPCEPGTHVVLEGIVWNETQNGILVVNVTWRGKTYVGTLMDATRHDWAPPRFNDETPPAEIEVRTPKGRGKRGRGSSTPVSESCTVGERRLRKTRGRMVSSHVAPPASPAPKRKGRPSETEETHDGPKAHKRGRVASRSATPNNNSADCLIDCPEMDCNKKYKHINGLRYHLTHTHKKNLIVDADGNMETEDAETTIPQPPSSPKLNLRRGQERYNTVHENTRRLDGKRDSKAGIRKPSVTLTKIDIPKDMDSSDGNDVFAMPQAPSDLSMNRSGNDISQNDISIKPDPDQIKNPKAPKSSRPNSLARPILSARTASVAPTSLCSVTTYPQVAAMTSSSGLQHDSMRQMKEKKSKKRKKDKDREKSSKEYAENMAKEGKPHLSVIKASTVSIPVAAVTPTVANSDRKQKSQDIANLAPVPCATPPQLLCPNSLPDLETEGQSPPHLQKQTGGGHVPILASASDNSSNQSHPRPPSQLSLNSPAVSQRADSEDIHSPAYSDISDAADAVLPTLENEVRDNKSSIQKENGTSMTNKSECKNRTSSGTKSPPPIDSRRPLSRGYDMYPQAFFGTPPYLSPAPTPDSVTRASPSQVSSVSNCHSPSLSQRSADIILNKSSSSLLSPSASPAGSREHTNLSNKSADSLRNVSANQYNAVLQNDTLNEKRTAQNHSHSLASPPSMGNRQSAVTVTTSSKDQQISAHRVYTGGNTPYPGYLATRGYGAYGIDPAYLHLMTSNPEYKAQHEKWIKEETRRRQEHMERQKHDIHTRGSSPHSYDNQDQKPVDMSAKGRIDHKSSQSPIATQSLHPARKDSLSSSSSRLSSENRNDNRKDRSELNLKEKLLENRQILKENLELKHQVKGSSSAACGESGHDPEHDPRAYYDHQQEELQRYYMYQQKYLAEQQRYMQEQSLKSPGMGSKHNRSGESPASVPVRDPSRERSSERPPSSSSSAASKETAKTRDPYASFKDSRRPHDDMDRDKTSQMRDHSIERPSQRSDMRTSSTHKNSHKEPVPCSTPTSSQASSYPAHYYSHYQGYEHPSMYSSNVMQYGANPGPYMHPSQIRYPHTPPAANDVDKDLKSKALTSPNNAKKLLNDGNKSADVPSDRNVSAFNSSPNHKIHELKEAAKPQEKVPCTPSKESSNEKTSASKDEKSRSSPPPQRHLHTHHHTHVVGAAYPLYPPYPALIASPQASSVPSMVSQPPFVSK